MRSENIPQAISAIITFIMIVEGAQIGYPVRTSAKDAPAPPAIHPTHGPNMKHARRIMLSPRFAYPRGIGIWIKAVII